MRPESARGNEALTAAAKSRKGTESRSIGPLPTDLRFGLGFRR